MAILSTLLLTIGCAVCAHAQASSPEAAWSSGANVFDGLGDAAALRPPGSPRDAGSGVEVITLSQLADRLSRNPQAVDALMAALKNDSSKLGGWPEMGALDASGQAALAQALKSSDKKFLDSFPTMTVPELRAFVAAYGDKVGMVPEPPVPAQETLALTGRPGQAKDGEFLTEWAPGLYHGDFTRHSASVSYGDEVAVTDALNNLALNAPGQAPVYTLIDQGKPYTDVGAWLSSLLASGHVVTARDRRFFANFGGIWYKQGTQWVSVVTPLWVDTGNVLPSGRKLIVPVAHSELDISIRGPRVNVDMSYYLGVGGGAQFYAQGETNKPWVGGRVARTYQSEAAVGLMARAAVTRRELIAKVKADNLPMGGYGPLGVCNDVEAMITGVPIYPQIRDPKYYQGGTTMDGWAAAQPVDDGRTPPSLERVWDSLAVQDPAQLEVPQARETIAELKRVLGR